MMEEEEDILFDRAGLLTNRVKPAREVRVPVNKRRVIKTLLLCTAFFGLVSDDGFLLIGTSAGLLLDVKYIFIAFKPF